MENCPCKANCPNGCPCPDYYCPARILAINTWRNQSSTKKSFDRDLKVKLMESPENKPMFFDYRGNTKALDMRIDNDTEVQLSCSVVWEGNMYLYGGLQMTRQVSKVSDCYLSRIGNLSFEFRGGTCASVNNNKIYWCFTNVNDSSTDKICYYSHDPLASEISSLTSNYAHRYTRIAYGNGKLLTFTTVLYATLGDILAVGSTGPGNAQTELLEVQTDTWSTHQRYPFSSQISRFSMVYQDQKFFIIGGSSGSADGSDDQSRISQFSQRTKTWSEVGHLNVKRRGHGAIFDGVELVVIGGYEAHSIEHCTLTEGHFECFITEQVKTYDFTNYVFYPELAIIGGTFCDT